MPNLPFPAEIPDLLYPHRKPVGGVKIDWEKGITRNLQFYTLLNTGMNVVDLAKNEKILNVFDKGYVEVNTTDKGQILDYKLAIDTPTASVNLDNKNLRDVFDGSTPFTFMCYALCENIASSQGVAFSIDGTDDFIIYLREKATGNFRIYWREGAQFSYENNALPGDKTWMIFTYTFDGIDSHKLYLDNRLVQTFTQTPTALAGNHSSGPQIGGWIGNSTQFYKDYLSWLCVYNRELPIEDISEIYNDQFHFLIPE